MTYPDLIQSLSSDDIFHASAVQDARALCHARIISNDILVAERILSGSTIAFDRLTGWGESQGRAYRIDCVAPLPIGTQEVLRRRLAAYMSAESFTPLTIEERKAILSIGDHVATHRIADKLAERPVSDVDVILSYWRI